MSARVAVLASGGGTNLQAILEHFSALGERAPGRVALVASDRAASGALERGKAAGADTAHVGRTAPDSDLAEVLTRHRINLIALAGYLRLVPSSIVRAFHGRVVNVHPALLPAFGGPGMFGSRVHAAVLASGARVSGATVHFVDEEFDRGPIIAQWPVPVRTDDTVDTLAARVLRAEHALYPKVVAALCAGTVRLEGNGRVTGWTDPPSNAHFELLE